MKLPNLGIEVKRLVNDGVWSIYQMREEYPVPFVLVQKLERLVALSTDGDVLPDALPDINVTSLKSEDIIKAVHFRGLPPRDNYYMHRFVELPEDPDIPDFEPDYGF